MKKALMLISILSLLIVIFVLHSLNLFGLWINRWTFPDRALRAAVSTYVDKDKNGVLSKKELEDATMLLISSPCDNLSGIKHLKNLERLSLCDCTDLSGIWLIFRLSPNTILWFVISNPSSFNLIAVWQDKVLFIGCI